MSADDQDPSSGVSDAISPGTSGVWQRGNNDSLKNLRGDDSESLKRSSSSLPTNQDSSKSAKLADAENVVQTIKDSSVNVVSGNQIIQHHHIQHHHYSIVADEMARKQDISNENLVQICNDNTKQATDIDILDDFRHEELQTPDFEVYPKMRQVDVHDYYKGRYGNSRFQGSRTQLNQLANEVGFVPQDQIKAKKIGVNDLLASMWQRETASSSKTVGVTAIVASAGSGKSTLTRRIARQALGIAERDDAGDLPSYNKKMVHHIELKDIPEMSEIKPSKFLFGGLYRSEEEEDLAFEWLDQHQSEAILIFDGLDQASWNFDGKDPRKIRKYDKASSWTVMYNILCRNILRQVKIYIASREFKISELPAPAQPETIITLSGLSLEDAHRLFAFLLQEEGEALWNKIETMSPRLLNFVSIPVFLILTGVVMGRDPSKPPPTTVTELYNRIITALQSVENIRNREQILLIVNKLKALAFQGMKDGRVVFKDTDLKQFGVSAKEVLDLMTKVPGNNLLSRHLIQGDFMFFFCHQSLQEYLAAIFVTEMEFREFRRFVKKYLHDERWCVVRRFVAGIVFSKSQSDLYRVPAQTEKKQVFARSIIWQLKNSDTMDEDESPVRMELYTAIYESDDDNLINYLPAIDLHFITLSRDQAHIIGSLTARIKSLHTLRLKQCFIDDELLGVIARCIKDRIHVNYVDLKYNNFSVKALRSLLGHRQIESLSGNLDWEVLELDVKRDDGYDDHDDDNDDRDDDIDNVVYVDFELKNGEDGFLIMSPDKISQLLCELSYKFEGYFSVEDYSLSFEKVLLLDEALATVQFFEKLFDSRCVKLKKIEKLFVKQDDFWKITEYQFEKISTIMLDSIEEVDIDWPLIRASLEEIHVDILDIAVNGRISTDDYNRILERGRAISVFGNVHALFEVGEGNEFKPILEAFQQKKIEYIRCRFQWRHRASHDEISSLVNMSDLKKITLIYNSAADILTRDELQKVQKFANGVNIESYILGVTFGEKREDAWQQRDCMFYDSELDIYTDDTDNDYADTDNDDTDADNGDKDSGNVEADTLTVE